MSRTVVNGEVKRTSPSALEKADPESGGCLRKWWYRYALGIKEEQSPSAALGERIHKEIEDYLLTGEPALSAIAMSAWEFFPALPQPLGIEHKVNLSDGFCVEGIPIQMKLDLINPSGAYIDPMGVLQQDPAGSIEVLDWKSTSNISYAKSGGQLLGTIQMSTYGKYMFDATDAKRVRLSHVYMQTKGKTRSKKSTILTTRDQIMERWPRIEAVARTIKDVARETDVNKIPANLSACPQFGGCKYKTRCPRTSHQTMTEVFGGALAMSLLPPSTPAPVTTPDAATQALLAREAQAAATEPPPDFVAAVKLIESSSVGFPATSHEAAELLCRMRGQEFKPGTGYAGMGRAGSVTITTRESMVSLAREVAKELGQEFSAPAPVLPIDAPMSDPAKAAKPVEGFTAPALAIVPDGGSVTVPTPAATAPAPEPPAATPPAPEPPAATQAGSDEILTPAEVKKLSRKGDRMAEYEKVYSKLQESGGEAPQAPAVTTGAMAGIYVNCAVAGAQPLEPYVDAATQRICQEFGCDDLRCAPSDGPLGYGRWKGALAAFVRANPPTAGVYTLDARGSEIREVVAEALSTLVVARGF